MKAGVGLSEGEGWEEKQRLVMGGEVGHNLNLLSKKMWAWGLEWVGGL